ncbi:hypothetical protein TNCV_1290331 [Trichonephila clavipes]|nr:hypothetical protein TNCV_1290331 [Trichonephila clavipes]
MNKAAPVLMSSEMRKIMKSIRSYLDTYQCFIDLYEIQAAGWVEWLVCRWPSAPKIADSNPAQVGGFS